MPISQEVIKPDGFREPAVLRGKLGAQRLASELIGCVDSRTVYWRYYLFAKQPGGRPISLCKHLFKVLDDTKNQINGPGRKPGVGRLAFDRTSETARASKNFLGQLERRYHEYYGPATERFWSPERHVPDRLREAARRFVREANYTDFFKSVDDAKDRSLAKMFRAHARTFCPSLADLLEESGFDVGAAVISCSHDAKHRFSDDLRRLILCWTVLRAYYGVSDETDDIADDGDQAVETWGSRDETKEIAEATLRLFRRVGQSGLSPSEQTAIESDLKRALKRPGPYAPPWSLSPRDEQGRRRRIFAGLRIASFNRILERTS